MAGRYYPRTNSKYGNRKTEAGGRTFDSTKEARRYRQLQALERAGVIYGLACQVRFELVPPQREPDTYGPRGGRKPGKIKNGYSGVAYYADFVYYEKDGRQVVEDVKGFKTDVYKIKKQLMADKYGIYISEV